MLIEEYLYNKDGSLLAAINQNTIETYNYTSNGWLEEKSANGEGSLAYSNKNGNVTNIIDSTGKST